MAQTALQDKKLHSIVKNAVIEAMQEVLMDPDRGLELQEWVKKRLRKRTSKLIPFDEIKKKYL